MNKYKTRGYVGIIGAVVAAVGMFLPFCEMLWEEISLAKLLSYSSSTFYAVLAFIVLVISATFYFDYERLHLPAQIISVICLVAYFIFWLRLRENELYDYIEHGIGFYVIIIGLILMNLSHFVPSLNKKIDSLFQN